jgi:sporulation protein YlmC with PRC-barrel domain
LISSELFGRHVVGEEGWKIGEVKDLVVDPSGWQVKALDVQLFPNVAEEFGMKKLLRGTVFQSE